jgi:hypothetical protein
MSADGNETPHAPAAGKHLSSGLYVRAAPGLRLRDKKVERLVRKMHVVMHWLEPSHFATCRAWAELEILAGQVDATLRAMGVVNSKGESRRRLDDYRKHARPRRSLRGNSG